MCYERECFAKSKAITATANAVNPAGDGKKVDHDCPVNLAGAEARHAVS